MKDYRLTGDVCQDCKIKPCEFKRTRLCKACHNIRCMNARRRRKIKKAKEGLADGPIQKPIGHEERLAAHAKRIQERCGIKGD